MHSQSLRKILFANSSLAIFLPLVLVLFFGWIWLVPLITSGLNERQHQLAEAIAGQVHSFLSVPESQVATIASLHPNDLTDDNRTHVQHIIDASVKSVPHLRSMYLLNSSGQVEALAITDDQKQARSNLLGLDMSRSDLYQRTRATKQIQWSETFPSLLGSGFSVAVAVPSGSWMLIGEIDLKELSLFLKKISIAKGHQLFIIDRQGQIIADQSGQYTVRQINLSNNTLIQQSIESGEDQNGSFDMNGTTMVGSLQKIETLGWWVLVAEPRISAYRQIWIAIGISVVGLFATALTILAAAILFSHRLARQIETLEAHSRLAAKGETIVNWPESDIAELDSLAACLDTMSRTLHERAKVLEHEITEREKAEYELHLNATLLEEEVSVRQRTEEALRVKHLQLEALNDSLEQRVQEELARNRDKDALMIQQSRLAAMGEMLSNIAHQWRQPLNELGIMIQMVRYDYDDGLFDQQKVEQFIASCMGTVQYMSNTINDFRDFFKQDRLPRLFNLETAINNAIGLVHASLQHASISVNLQLDRQCMIMGHSNELSQVVLNIVNNARDALVERKITDPSINLVCHTMDGHALISISDNAGGIDPDIIDKIFDPYFTTRHKSQGTGLGLYMSRMILENKLGGQITVRNTREGAQFQISIPCDQDKDICVP